jgi:hypothetical protein
MLPKWNSRLCSEIATATHWNLARCRCLANIVIGILASRSVKLDDLAAHVPGRAQFSSKTRRMQYFFQRFEMAFASVALLVIAMLGCLPGEKWLLALDRTNWERRGKSVNLLTLAVCLGDVAIPLFWEDLGRKGNSKTRQRILLLERFIEAFGEERILALTADREFVGQRWFRWLQRQKIPFVLRVKDNFKVLAGSGWKVPVSHCFRNLKLCEARCLGMKRICGVELEVSGLRLPGNEYVIVVSCGVAAEEALDIYRKRWKIETLFEKLKGHGFDLEGTRLRGEGKLDKLMVALAVAAAWCYCVGEWHVREVAAPLIKSHGRLEKSVLRVGLDILRQIISGCAAEMPRFSRVAMGFLRRLSSPPEFN